MAIDFNAPSQVRPYANLGAFPATGAVKTIYIAEDTNYIYRWNGAAYIEISVADLVGYVPYTGATQDVNLGAYDAYVNKLWLYDAVNDNYGSTHYTDGNYHIEDADGHKLLVIEDGFIQLHKTDTIQSNLYTSGLTATRDHYLPDASGTIALTSNLAGYVPTSRTLTINGTTQDLSADRTFTISTGITIGTTAITSGTVGRVLFEGTGNVVSESANLFWDNTNGRLAVNVTGAPTRSLEVWGTTRLNGAVTCDGNITLVAGNSVLNCGFITIGNGGTTANIRTDNAKPISLFPTPSTESLRLFANGNLVLQSGGTFTDAGFKLDVNGTARVNTLTIGLGGGQIATNTTLGFQAGNATATTGGSTYIGYQAGNKNTAGSITAIGHTSALNNTSGDGITAIGGRALLSNTTGNYNTALGYSSLLSNTTGSSNTAMGVDTSSGNFTGSVILGRNATATANNQFVVGSSGINAGSVTTEVNASTQVWNVVINGVAYKILLA